MKPVTVTLISNASLETPRKLTPSDTKALGVPLQVRDDYLRSLPKMNITHLTTVEATPENTEKLKRYIMSHKYQIRDMILLLHNYLQIQVIGAISKALQIYNMPNITSFDNYTPEELKNWRT